MKRFSISRIMVCAVMSLLLCLALRVTNFASAQTKLVFWSQVDMEVLKADTAMIELFEKKYPEIKIEYIQVPDHMVKLSMALVAGNQPDLFFTRGTVMQKFIKPGQLLRVTPEVMTKKELEKIIDYTTGNSAYLGEDGEYYGVPYTVLFGHNGMVVNLDLIEKAGLTKPNTWEELMQAGKKMTVKTGDIITQAGFSRTEWDTYLTIHSLIWQMGGEFYDPETKRFDYTTPEAEEAYEFWRKSYLEGSGPSFTDNFTGFLEGRLGIMIVQSWMNSYTKLFNPDLRFDYWRVPPIDVKGLPGYIPTMSGVGLAALEPTKYPEETRLFLKFVIEDPGALLAQNNWAGNIPANSALWDSPIYKEGGRMGMVNWVFDTIMTPGLVREAGIWPDEGLIQDEVRLQFDKFLRGEITVKEALTGAEKVANEMMEYYFPG